MKVAKKVIDGVEYQIYCLGAEEGFEMGTKIATAITPLFENLVGEEVEIDFQKVIKLVSTEFGNGQMLTMIKRLLRGLAVDGSDVKFDEYFSCNYGTMIKVAAFAVQENFGSFLEGLDILGE